MTNSTLHRDEVHEVAKQLEHIHSEELMLRLEKFWAFPNMTPTVIPFRLPMAN